ncbi:unnamed protein product [Urochloa decumbens]|uniref:Protein kinase domain-containing protein n=1 Tax=Urochloa decumbens TaxID=240449 RepID=A0ABC9BRM8_9POAL
MDLLVVLLILLTAAAATTTAGNGGGRCRHWCKGSFAPHPFGFSGDCPILLACNPAITTPLLPRSTAAAPYPIVSFDSSASTFLVAIAPSCNRSVSETKESLSGAGYGVSSRTGFFLHGGCSRAPPANSSSSCSVPSDLMTKLLRKAQCGAGAAGGNGTAASWTCVSSAPPDPSSAAAARGTLMPLDAAAAGGRCAVNSTCHDVETPSGAWGHRCACPAGMSGYGFDVGDGCYYGDFRMSPAEYLPPLAIGVSIALLLLLWLWKWRRHNTKAKIMCKTNTNNKQASHGGARLFRGVLVVDDVELEEGVTGPKRFCYDELAAATRNFSDDRRLGSGGFGSVYRGFMEDTNRDVAVKKVSKTSRQGWKEFVSEVRIISRLRHRNLVQLISWCHGGAGDCNDDELLLVYELMHNRSLDAHLYDSEHVMTTWLVRYGIALGVGSALVYLHEDAERRVVHRDIKPSNVMLDASFTAKLGDFGLARLIDDGRRSHTTGVAGTMGYMDPECLLAGRVDVTSDVYSFGVLLLEVTCGRRPAVRVRGEEQDGEEYVHLVQWVWDSYGSGSILDAADGRRLRRPGDGVRDGRRALVHAPRAQPASDHQAGRQLATIRGTAAEPTHEDAGSDLRAAGRSSWLPVVVFGARDIVQPRQWALRNHGADGNDRRIVFLLVSQITASISHN